MNISRSETERPIAVVGEVHASDMTFIPGGTFRMGSDRHYPEEAPCHTVGVDGFWIDQTPVTNRQFKEFVRATGHVTFAEVAPDPANYPDALPHLIFEGLPCRAMSAHIPAVRSGRPPSSKWLWPSSAR